MLKYLEKVISGADLSAREMSDALELMASGTVPDAQSGALLTALRMKGESLSELLGAARLLRRKAVLIDCGGRESIDIVGTGGDGGISFNISTTAALVAAGAGACVAKHGNRAVSGKCGAADVLAQLGYNLDTESTQVEASIQEHGIGFMFAPKLHPIMAAVAPLRRQLRTRTIFNLLGPLCNPAGANGIVLGVFAAPLTELFAAVLRELGVRRALVVHGHDGLDEISCGATTRVAELRDGEIHSYELFPELLLGSSFDSAELAGGDPARNAQIMLSILNCEDHGAPRAAVVLNAAAALVVSGLAADLKMGVTLAEKSIDSGAAREKLHTLINASKQ